MNNTIVQLCTIKAKYKLYKGEEEATNIELLEMVENGFPIVSGKDLYQVGEIVYLIEPDYCLPDSPLFEDYIRPNGDASKSKLGKNNRLKAIKFNLHKGDGNPTFSYGIILPRLFANKNESNLAEELGITKYEAPDDSKGNVIGGASKPFPIGMYKTDEPNWNKVCNYIEFPINLVGNVKQDGCLEENTLLITPNGERTVQELSSIDYRGLILSRNLHNSTNEFVKVKNWSVRENTNNWLKLTLEDGTEIIVTENHPFWLEEEKCYRKAENLILGNILTII